MKLWLMTAEYAPFFGGGIATYCGETAKMLARHGHEVTIFTVQSAGSAPCTEELADGTRVVRFAPEAGADAGDLGTTAALSWRFAQVITAAIRDRGQPDVIECHEFLGIGYFLLQQRSLLWPELADVRVLTTMHTPKYLCDYYDQAPLYRFPNFWTAEMERFVVRATDALVSPSRYLVNELKRWVDLDDVHPTVLPNPFELPHEQPPPPNQNGELVFLGRLQKLKGVIELVRCFATLWDQGLTQPLRLLGGDTYFYPRSRLMSAYLRKQFEPYVQRGLLVIEGSLSPARVRQSLATARLVFIPSLFENFPYAAVEAMAHGRAVVATASGGQRELIEDGRSGLLADPAPDGLARAIAHGLALDDTALQRLGQQAAARIGALCDPEVVYPQKLAVLQKVAARAARSEFPFARRLPRKTQAEPRANAGGLLSVVVPYFNMGAYVRETLASLRAADYRPLEIVVVDDGSSEDQQRVLAAAAQEFDARVVRQPNAGLAAARNTGAREARGDYLAFLDPDDLVTPEYYPWAVRLLRHYHDLSFVGCWTEYFGEGKGIWPGWNPEPPYLLVHNMVNSSALVFRRDDFVSNGLNDPRMEYGMEDYEAVVRLVLAGLRGVVIPKPFFRYRVRLDSMARQFNPDNLTYLYRVIAEKHAAAYAAYGPEIFQLLNENGPGYLFDNPSCEMPPVGYLRNEGWAYERLRAIYRRLRHRRAIGALLKRASPLVRMLFGRSH